MNNDLENFIASRLPITGVAAYRLQSGAIVLANECFSKSLYARTAGELLSGMIRAGRSLLPPEEGAGARYCWTFECFRVYVAARPDGSSLALLVESGQRAEKARILETLAAFLEVAPEPEPALVP